jgi:hypothetical protein
MAFLTDACWWGVYSYHAVMAFSTFLEKRLCPADVLLSCLSDGGNLQVRVPTLSLDSEHTLYWIRGNAPPPFCER